MEIIPGLVLAQPQTNRQKEFQKKKNHWPDSAMLCLNLSIYYFLFQKIQWC